VSCCRPALRAIALLSEITQLCEIGVGRLVVAARHAPEHAVAREQRRIGSAGLRVRVAKNAHEGSFNQCSKPLFYVSAAGSAYFKVAPCNRRVPICRDDDVSRSGATTMPFDVVMDRTDGRGTG
jgi:hypothetical protein